MEIRVNNVNKTIADNCTIEQLLQELFPEHQRGIGVAVNSQVITKDQWQAFSFKANDDVLIIKATQGG